MNHHRTLITSRIAGCLLLQGGSANGRYSESVSGDFDTKAGSRSYDANGSMTSD